MARSAFSDRWLKSLKPLERRRDFGEPGRRGFILRVWPGGEKTFVMRYKRGGKTRIMTLGQYPAISLAEAHDAHAQAQRDLRCGLDPIEAREHRAAEALRAEAKTGGNRTVAQLVEEFTAHGLTRRDGTPYEEPDQVRRLLAAEVLGKRYDRKTKTFVESGDSWATRTLDSITGREAVELCQAIERRGSAATARITGRYLKRMFAYAVTAYLVPANPLDQLRFGKGAKRARWLKPDEIAKVWAVLSSADAPMAPDTRLAFKLLLLTGQRAGEVCAAEWQHIDLKKRTWHLPAAITKSRRAHTVPLSPTAVEILNKLREMHPTSPYVIPGRSASGKLDYTRARDPHSLAHAVRDHVERWGIDPWVPHDLRRTMRTHLPRLKVSRDIAERILNHASSELDQVYDHHDYLAEMRAALVKWDTELQRIIRPKLSRPAGKMAA
jgi:integrase